MEGALGDVDVVYCDANEPVDGAQRYEAELRGAYPALCWEVTNQAWVHVWYAAKVGHEVAPLGSVLEGLATWPETATAVAVRLAADDQIELLAPFGVSDLFDLVVRHNPARASAATYRERSAQKLWARRWPELRILPAAAS